MGSDNLLNEIVSNEENIYQEKYKAQKLFKHNEYWKLFG